MSLSKELLLSIDHIPASVAMFDREMCYVAVSKRWMTDNFIGDRDIIGYSHYAIFPEIMEKWKVVHRRCLSGETIRADEDRFIRSDGSTQWKSWVAQPWYMSDGSIGGIVIFSEDITRFKLAEEEIRRLNETLERRVIERTTELTVVNSELDSFSYAVSHDLRGPLNTIRQFSKAIVEDYGKQLQSEVKVFLDQINISCYKMDMIIDGLLTLSRSTRTKLHQDSVDVSTLATQLLEELAHNEPERIIEWHVEPNLSAMGDARLIEVVFRNLLSNAWKFTSQTAAPVIKVSSSDVEWQQGFCVSDNGAGFNMAHIKQLFRPFKRLHRQDEFPGLGIGLSTVQRIIQRHGGRIQAEGRVNAGATFRFTFPNHKSLKEIL